jgi:hypothetical protein
VLSVLASAFALAACGGGDEESPPATTEEEALELPDGAIAFVDEVGDGEVTQEEFDEAVAVAAAADGRDKPAAEGTPEYALEATTALSGLLVDRWVRGEAEELGITVTTSEVSLELERTIEANFASQAAYEKFLEDSGLSEEQATERIELQLLSDAVGDEILGKDPAAAGKNEQTKARDELTKKWRERTVCSEELFAAADGQATAEEQLAESCSNFN